MYDRLVARRLPDFSLELLNHQSVHKEAPTPLYNSGFISILLQPRASVLSLTKNLRFLPQQVNLISYPPFIQSSIAMSMSTLLESSSTRLSNTDNTMALGDTIVPPELGGNLSYHDTTQPLTTKPRATSGSALVKNTKTFTHWNKESDVHVTRISSTPTTFAGRQAATFPPHPRPTSSPNEIDTSPEHSDTMSASVQASTSATETDHTGTSALELVVSDSRSTHRRNVWSNTNEIVSSGQADFETSFLSRIGAEPVRSPTIASGQLQKRPKPLAVQRLLRSGALYSSVNTTPSSNTTTSPSNLGTFTVSPQTMLPHHYVVQDPQQKPKKWLIKNWDSVISTLTLVLVIVGSICTPISTYRSGIANHRSYQSFRLTQLRNCIDLGVSRSTLMISMFQRRADVGDRTRLERRQRVKNCWRLALTI